MAMGLAFATVLRILVLLCLWTMMQFSPTKSLTCSSMISLHHHHRMSLPGPSLRRRRRWFGGGVVAHVGRRQEPLGFSARRVNPCRHLQLHSRLTVGGDLSSSSSTAAAAAPFLRSALVPSAARQKLYQQQQQQQWYHSSNGRRQFSSLRLSRSSFPLEEMPLREQRIVRQISAAAAAAASAQSKLDNLTEGRESEDDDDGDDQEEMDEEEHDDSLEEDVVSYTSLPEGMPKGFHVIEHYSLPTTSFQEYFEPSLSASASSFTSSMDDDEGDDKDKAISNGNDEGNDQASSSSKSKIQIMLGEQAIQRLQLTPCNLSLPAALMMVNPTEFPSFSQARKVCRKGNILLHRGPLLFVEESSSSSSSSSSNSTTSDATFKNNPSNNGSSNSNRNTVPVFDHAKCKVGRVKDRVFPGDVIARQVRMGGGYFPVLGYKKPPFEVPVVYEDDHWALVYKPAGIVVYTPNRQGGYGIMTLRAALPFVLHPPKEGTYSVLRRPASVHRLDRPTSGLVCVAKTKPAMLNLSKQFHDRIVQKTYMAIVNGVPLEYKERQISAKQAYETMGVDVDPNAVDQYWNVIEEPLDGQWALTLWRAVRYVPSQHAANQCLTLVEIKPKTGRFHQIRRHMAWHVQCPLIGDVKYDGAHPKARKLRDRGLFLCATRITLQHPYYNNDHEGVVEQAQRDWKQFQQQQQQQQKEEEEQEKNDSFWTATTSSDTVSDSSQASWWGQTKIWLDPKTNKVMIRAEIDLPAKFESFLQHEQGRYEKFNNLSEQSEQQQEEDENTRQSFQETGNT